MLKTINQKWGWKANLAFSIFSVVFFFTITETTLILTGFNYSQFPRFMNIKMVDSYINWQSSNSSLQRFIPHKKRMWAAMPNKGIVNGLGYIGKKISLEKIPGVKRILFLGDSCTAGEKYYPDRAIKILNTRWGIKAEPLIAATGGYSTFQGLDVLKDTVKYNPDILISYFGWNDHWLAIGGMSDNDFKEMTDLQIFIHNVSAKFRTYQLLHFMIYPPQKHLLENISLPHAGIKDIVKMLRVPPDYFVNNIRSIIKIAEENNTQVYFIAAPMGPHITETDQSYLLPNKFISMAHSFYLDLLKKTASEYPDVHVIDFKNLVFDKLLMMADGIHPTAKGHDVIAEGVVKNLLESAKLEYLKPEPQPTDH